MSLAEREGEKMIREGGKKEIQDEPKGNQHGVGKHVVGGA